MGKRDNAKLIDGYSRADAIADGVLFDVSGLVGEAGFPFHIAVSFAVWEHCIAVPKGSEGVQDEAGRLWDILNVLQRVIPERSDLNQICFPLVVQSGPGTHREVRLKAICGPGADGLPALTLLYQQEG